jgi:cysteine desulfurase / selenocysteine lyase
MLYLPAEFPQDPELCYLNHAAVAPWPKRAAEAVQRFAFENMTSGATHYPQWIKVERQLRERLAWLINADSADDIALVKNTSEGLSFVAAGLDWRPGERIVGIADDFPSNRVVWEALHDRGVHFDTVDTNAADDPERALIAAITPDTRLMAISSVHFATGVRLDLPRIAAACRERGVLLCVDAIQSLGALRFDLQQVPADFVVADGHKWMLGAEGLGLFYVRPALRERLRLTQFGWAMREQPGDYSANPWSPAESARRFECGSPNMLGIQVLSESLGLLQEVGWQTVEARLQTITDRLIEQLTALPGCRLRTPSDWLRRAGIVSFDFEGKDSEQLHNELMKAGVICASRGGFVRFSPHFYTRDEVVDNAVRQLAGLTAR